MKREITVDGIFKTSRHLTFQILEMKDCVDNAVFFTLKFPDFLSPFPHSRGVKFLEAEGH